MWQERMSDLPAFMEAGGELAEYVVTFDGPDGSKVALRPFAYWGRPGWEPIGDGFRLPGRFTVDALTHRGDRISVEVVVSDGRARVAEVHVIEASEHGITGLMLDGLALQALVEVAARALARLPGAPERSDLEPLELFEQAERAAAASTRKRMTETRLEEVAAAYKAWGIHGVIDLGVSERHAYRLKRRAIDAGLLPKENDR